VGAEKGVLDSVLGVLSRPKPPEAEPVNLRCVPLIQAFRLPTGPARPLSKNFGHLLLSTVGARLFFPTGGTGETCLRSRLSER
jgi:hypothetical protein